MEPNAGGAAFNVRGSSIIRPPADARIRRQNGSYLPQYLHRFQRGPMIYLAASYAGGVRSDGTKQLKELNNSAALNPPVQPWLKRLQSGIAIDLGKWSKAIAKSQSPTTFAKRQREFNKKAKAQDKLAKRADRQAQSDASRSARQFGH